MQPPAQIQSAQHSDRRIFEQGLFNNEKQSATFCRGLFFAASLIFKSKLSPVFFKRRHEPTVASIALRRARKLFLRRFLFIAFSFAAAMSKEKADRKPSPEREGGARSVTDEALFLKRSNFFLCRTFQ